MKQTNQTILCVDDNKDSRELIRMMFQLKGYQVTISSSLQECLFYVRQNDFQAIVLDNRFGEKISFEACREIRNFNPTVPIIFYSGDSTRSALEKAVAAGANAYLVKPSDFDKLTDTVIELIEKNN